MIFFTWSTLLLKCKAIRNFSDANFKFKVLDLLPDIHRKKQTFRLPLNDF